MSEFKFSVGDKIRRAGWGPDAEPYFTVTAVGQTKILVTAPSAPGLEYQQDVGPSQWGEWEPYVPPPKRYVVEIRKPKRGEKYISPGGYVTEATLNFGHDEHPVIVEEL